MTYHDRYTPSVKFEKDQKITSSLITLVKEGVLTLAEAAKEVRLSEDDFTSLILSAIPNHQRNKS